MVDIVCAEVLDVGEERRESAKVVVGGWGGRGGRGGECGALDQK